MKYEKGKLSSHFKKCLLCCDTSLIATYTLCNIMDYFVINIINVNCLISCGLIYFHLTYMTYAVHVGGGPRDGFCMVTVSQVDLSVASLDASVRPCFAVLGDAVQPSFRRTTSGSVASDIAFHCLFWISCVLHSVNVAEVFQSFHHNPD